MVVADIDWNETHAITLAPQLIGWELACGETSGRIVEVEAYEPDDPASHTYRGKTKRNATMFGPPGTLYSYFIYGIHVCANVVVGPPGRGAAVLIRALEPINGVDVMTERRNRSVSTNLCSGPGKLCQALDIGLADDGLDLLDGASRVRLLPPTSPVGPIVAGPRVGISKAVDRPWRYGEEGSRHLSRPFPVEPVVGERR